MHIRFLIPVVLVCWALVIWRYNPGFLGIAIFFSLGLLAELINVIYIRRKAARNPAFLDERIK